MNTQDIERLYICREDICSDVIFQNIATALIQAELLNRDEFQQVHARDSDSQKMTLVLDILPSKGLEALNKFISVLQKDYQWVASKLLAAKPSTSTPSTATDCSSNNRERQEQQLKQKISTDMLTLVCKNYKVCERWTSLAHSLQLDNQIAPIRMKIFVFSEDPNLSIMYLLKEWMSQCPKTANLGNLIATLKENSFNDIVDELEQKYLN